MMPNRFFFNASVQRILGIHVLLGVFRLDTPGLLKVNQSAFPRDNLELIFRLITPSNSNSFKDLHHIMKL